MRKSYKHISTILFIILLIQVLDVNAQRFPKPEFESGYVQESVQAPVPRSDFMEYFDVLVLIVAMSVVSWFVLKKRSRRGVVLGFNIFNTIFWLLQRRVCLLCWFPSKYCFGSF